MWSVLWFVGVLVVVVVIEAFSDGLTGYGDAVDGKMSRRARIAHEFTYTFSGFLVTYAVMHFFL